MQIEADKYFASVPFPEVERIVGKKMLQTYMKYIPVEQRIAIFQIIDKRFKGNSDAFKMCIRDSDYRFITGWCSYLGVLPR